MPPRKGLNCTLSYVRGTATRTYRVRCVAIVHGTQMIAEESQARVHRAYYPHRVSTQRFGITVQLNGYKEHKSLSNWLATYASYALHPNVGGTDYPTMSVVVPAREFVHRGVPLTGFVWGDHVGSMVFSPTIMFEPAYEPWDKVKPAVTRVENTWDAFAQDDAIKYFYPFSDQLKGEEEPENYDVPVYPGVEDEPDSADPPVNTGPGTIPDYAE